MASILKVDTIQDQSGNNIINESADTITIGASGDTVTIPSGATISNLGTATGFGKVLQVVQSSQSSVVSLTSTSYTDTGLSGTITPTSSSSKIYVVTFAQFGVPSSASSGDDVFIRLLRDATVIGGAGNIDADSICMVNESGGNFESRYLTINYLDSPSTTSAITYKLQFRNRNAAKQAYFNRRGGDTLQCGNSYITLIEVSG
jgi:hypothetical protein